MTEAQTTVLGRLDPARRGHRLRHNTATAQLLHTATAQPQHTQHGCRRRCKWCSRSTKLVHSSAHLVLQHLRVRDRHPAAVQRGVRHRRRPRGPQLPNRAWLAAAIALCFEPPLLMRARAASSAAAKSTGAGASSSAARCPESTLSAAAFAAAACTRAAKSTPDGCASSGSAGCPESTLSGALPPVPPRSASGQSREPCAVGTAAMQSSESATTALISVHVSARSAGDLRGEKHGTK